MVHLPTIPVEYIFVGTLADLLKVICVLLTTRRSYMISIRFFSISLMMFSLLSVSYLVTSVSAQGGNSMDPNHTMQGGNSMDPNHTMQGSNGD